MKIVNSRAMVLATGSSIGDKIREFCSFLLGRNGSSLDRSLPVIAFLLAFRTLEHVRSSESQASSHVHDGERS